MPKKGTTVFCMAQAPSPPPLPAPPPSGKYR